jgi:hypothetical protein
VNDTERAEVEHQVKCLRLAAWDMDQAHSGAISIPHSTFAGVRAVLETGLAVSYARPFTRSDAKPRLNLLHLLPDGRQDGSDWLPEDPLDLGIHGQLMRLRNEVYAHTDDTEWRKVVNAGSIIEGAEHLHAVRWSLMPDDWLAKVAPMVERQRDRFKREARARELRLSEPK